MHSLKESVWLDTESVEQEQTRNVLDQLSHVDKTVLQGELCVVQRSVFQITTWKTVGVKHVVESVWVGMLSVRRGVQNVIQGVQNAESAAFQMNIMRDMDTPNVQGNAYQELRNVVAMDQ